MGGRWLRGEWPCGLPCWRSAGAAKARRTAFLMPCRARPRRPPSGLPYRRHTRVARSGRGAPPGRKSGAEGSGTEGRPRRDRVEGTDQPLDVVESGPAREAHPRRPYCQDGISNDSPRADVTTSTRVPVVNDHSVLLARQWRGGRHSECRAEYSPGTRPTRLPCRQRTRAGSSNRRRGGPASRVRPGCRSR